MGETMVDDMTPDELRHEYALMCDRLATAEERNRVYELAIRKFLAGQYGVNRDGLYAAIGEASPRPQGEQASYEGSGE